MLCFAIFYFRLFSRLPFFFSFQIFFIKYLKAGKKRSNRTLNDGIIVKLPILSEHCSGLEARNHKESNYTESKRKEDKMPYSSATSIMTSRDHPFNQSSRPLLAERKTQFLVKKNNKFNINNNSSKSSSQKQNCITNNTAGADRESLKVHGINDFDLISQQYRTYNNHNMGYPYGSPPSPRSPVFETQKNDFLFSDKTNYQTNGGNNYYNSNVNNWQQQQLQQQFQNNHHLHNPHHEPQDIYDSVINNSKYSGLQTSLVTIKNFFFSIWDFFLFVGYVLRLMVW